MDSLITAAARALATGDPLGALKRVNVSFIVRRTVAWPRYRKGMDEATADRIADEIIANLKLSNWRIHRGPPLAAHGMGLLGKNDVAHGCASIDVGWRGTEKPPRAGRIDRGDDPGAFQFVDQLAGAPVAREKGALHIADAAGQAATCRQSPA
jgi:hypothetical protein